MELPTVWIGSSRRAAILSCHLCRGRSLSDAAAFVLPRIFLSNPLCRLLDTDLGNTFIPQIGFW